MKKLFGLTLFGLKTRGFQRTLGLVEAALLTALVIACGGGAPQGRGGAEEAQIFAVTTIMAETGLINAYLTLAGDIVAGSTVDAYSDAAGKITQVYVSNGSRVTRGQAVALVDPSKPGMRYTQHTVRAPISGIITARPAEVGMTVSQATPLVKISGGGGLEIQLHVPERYISRIREGLASEISLDAYPDEIFRGTVYELSPTIDTASRTEAIKVSVDNQGSRLKPGMFAKVKIITANNPNAVIIPSQAIVERQGKSVVYITQDGGEGKSVREAEVEVGIISDGRAEIRSGVNAKDEVVDKGMSLLTDGVRVNIINTRSEADGAGGGL